jgi:UDP-3-O-[3-hydroxymyristoyl] glucosamine N-acyltransferase
VEKSVVLGDGNVVLAGANIGSCVKLGNLNYLNTNSLVSHDCILEENIHVAPGAVLASSIRIESHVLIGMNTTIYYGLRIGESSTVLNGLVVNNNIGKNIIQKTNN